LNPPLTFANALIQLKLLTSQTGNFTFTDDELTLALQEAWNDTYVVNTLLDSTTSFVAGTYTYAVPTALSTVMEIYYKPTSTDPMQAISKELYSIVNGQIIFLDNVSRWLDDTYTLYIKGRIKLATTDSLTTKNLINYVLNLSAELLLSSLLLKKTFVFLTNDTTVSEIAAALNIIQGQVLRYKQALLREFESA
jgi:hypothetical protein